MSCNACWEELPPSSGLGRDMMKMACDGKELINDTNNVFYIYNIFNTGQIDITHRIHNILRHNVNR
jgi:hypothetical protein